MLSDVVTGKDSEMSLGHDESSEECHLSTRKAESVSLTRAGVGGYRAEFPGTSSPHMVRNCTGEILVELPDDYLGSRELVKFSPTYQKSAHHYLATD